MEIICCAIVFFSIVLLARKIFGTAGENVAIGCLVVGSLLFIASLPVACYLILRFVVPML